jgi:hypothetical protein
VQKSLVDDIRAVVKSSNTEEVRVGTSARDIQVAKRRAEVSLAIFYFSHSTISAIQFSCQVFYFMSVILCLRLKVHLGPRVGFGGLMTNN